MRAQFLLSDLIPSELNVDGVRDAGDAIIVAAYGRSVCAVHAPLIYQLQQLDSLAWGPDVSSPDSI